MTETLTSLREWWTALHFLRPHLLWLLLAAPILYLSFRIRDDVRSRWKRYIDSDLLDHLIVTRKRRWRLRPIHMITALIILGGVAISGPTWKREQPPFSEDKAPLVIVLDLSPTMNAIDLDPTRLERARLKLRDLLTVRNGGRTALFVYAGTTHMVLPFTTDNSLFDLYLNSLSTSLMPAQGKDTAKALHTVEAFLKDESVPGTILFVTDGIEPQSLPAFRQFTAQQDNPADILVMGVGTAAGGPVRSSPTSFLSDRTGRRVFSRLDVEALRSLSSIGISATTLTLNDDDIHWIQRRVQHHLETEQQKNSKTRWIDEGYWLTFPITAIAVFWFRKGWTVRWTSAAAAFLIVLPSAGLSSFSWLDLWLTHDQQGRYLFQKGEFQKAAARFDDPLWRGFSFARAGDFEDALNAFALSDTAEAWFNQGDALAHLGKFPEAAEAFQQALVRRHSWPEAEQNLALVQSLIPKPKDPNKEKQQQQEIPPNLPPDQIKMDDNAKNGKKILVQQLDPKKMADIWMRNIQTTPADFLRRRFAIQAAQERRP